MLTVNALLLTALWYGIIVRGSREWDPASRGSSRNRHGFSALRAILTGMGHSGTTVTAKILFNAPCVIGATETGFFMAKTPGDIRNIHPFIDWHMNMDIKDMYMLKSGDVDALAKAKDFPQMLDILRNRSHLFNNLIDEPYCDKPYQMIDKTPGYMNIPNFERILKETHSAQVPVIVLKKSYESLNASTAKRWGHGVPRHSYDSTYNNVERMIRKYPNRIMVVHWNDMLLDIESVMQEIFYFIGLEWRSNYLKMTNLKKKFASYGERVVNAIDGWHWVENTRFNQ